YHTRGRFRQLEFRLTQALQQLAVGRLAALEAGETGELVGGVELLVVEAEAKRYGVGAQVRPEQLGHRDRATRPDVEGLLAVQLRQNVARGPVAGMVGGKVVWLGPTGKRAHRHFRARRRVLRRVAGELLHD